MVKSSKRIRLKVFILRTNSEMISDYWKRLVKHANWAHQKLSTPPSLFMLTYKECCVGVGVFLLSVLVRFYWLLPQVVSSDDYQFDLSGQSSWFVRLTSQGRFTGGAVYEFFLQCFGLTVFDAFPLFGPILLLSLVIAGLVTARIWKLIEDPFLLFLILGLLALHPYIGDIMHYKMTVWMLPFALMGIFLPLKYVSFNRYFPLWVCCFAIGIGGYQTIALFSIIITVAAAMLEMTRALINNGSTSIPKILMRSRFFPRTALIGFGAITYALINKILLWMFTIEACPYPPKIASLRELFISLRHLPRLLYRVYAQSESHLGLPVMVKYAVLIVIASGVVLLCSKIIFKAGLTVYKKSELLCFYLLAVSCILLTPFIPYVLSGTVSTHPRVFLTVSLSIAVMMVLLLLITKRNRLLYRSAIILSGFVVFGCILSTSYLHTNERRIREQDYAWSIRILSSLENQPGYLDTTKLIILCPVFVTYTEAALDTPPRIRSAFSFPWSRAELFKSIIRADKQELEMVLMHPIDEGKYEKTPTNVFQPDRICMTPEKTPPDTIEIDPQMPIWPSPGSIVIKDHTAILRLH